MSEKPTISVPGIGKISVNDCRNRISSLLAQMASGVNRGDIKAEEYAAASFGSESELSLLIRALIKSRKKR